MKPVNLKRFGLNLSGHPLGINALPIIIAEYEPPYSLDFSGVFSIGSSFADEVVEKLAERNGGKIEVLNSNNVIDKCLKDVSNEKGFTLIIRKGPS